MKIVQLALIAAVVFAGAEFSTGAAYAGCYRLGATGDHWYRSCVGPRFLYPHHRHCHRHYGCRYH
jgi:hypothetical protein